MVPQLHPPGFLGAGATYGKYRKSAQTAHGNSVVVAGTGNAGVSTAANAITFAPGGITAVPSGAWVIAGTGCYPAPESIEHAGIKAGEIEAWRVWLLRDEEWLTSVFLDTVWAPGEAIVGDTLSAGVHAWKELGSAVSYIGGEFPVSCPAVIGQVALWGEVIEHELGYRAENAKIISLDYAHGVPVWKRRRLLERLRQKYLPAQPSFKLDDAA